VDSVRPAAERTYVAPRTEVEEGLARIWREVLHVDRVGIEDNFFELGGHSLLAVQVISRIRRIFDVEVSVRSIFDEPVIAGLAEEVAKARAAGLRARVPVLTRRAPTDHREMLIAQMDKLSPEELRALVDRVITKKSSTPAGETKSGEQALPYGKV
jgi:acyl carrier protein